ncbi:MAG: hypothetical protein ACRDQ7_24265 [Haloechinothrix sp.]
MIEVLATEPTVRPAGGSETLDIVILATSVSVGFLVVGLLGLRHRRGHTTLLGRTADATARLLGGPAWATLPMAVALASMATAYIGYMWDASIHINNGRDIGPFGNPSHIPMMIGLYGILISGLLAVMLPKPGERPGPIPVRIAPGWRVPVGGVLLLTCGFFAFLGFPLDEVWHRLFGQDVTVWGPTHVLMLSGAILSVVGLSVLFAESVGDSWHPAEWVRFGPARRFLDSGLPVLLAKMALPGLLLVGFSALLAEYDYGAPLFQLWLQPTLIALFAAFAFTLARVWAGRPGSALVALAVFLAARVAIAILVGPVLGEGMPAFPLMAAEAVCVEIAALVLRRRPLLAGTVGGVLIGTIGFGTEWLWAAAAMPTAWTTPVLVPGMVSATVAGVAGGIGGALLGMALTGTLPRARTARALTVGALAAVIGVVGNGLVGAEGQPGTATVTLTDVAATPERRAMATVRFTPAQLTEGATYVRVLAYQGGPPVESQALDKIGPGVFHTVEPIPVSGRWKTLIRIGNGRAMQAVPVYLPADPGIPAPEVAAPARFTRPVIDQDAYLMREWRTDTPAWLAPAAGLVVLALGLAFITLISLGAARFGRRPKATTSAPEGILDRVSS